MQPPRTVAQTANRLEATSRSETGARQPQPLTEPIRVLLISDLLLMRPGLRHFLEISGIRIVGELSTFAEAVAHRQRPDIMLLDLDSRSETFACVEGLAARGHPIIALSDRHRAGDHATLVELGLVGLVLKHERPEVLISAIKKVHAGEVWIDRVNTAEALARFARRRHVYDAEDEKIISLTRREREIVSLVGAGLKNAAVAERLSISAATVRNHLTSVLDKLGLSDRFELAVYAYRHGLVQYGDGEAPTTTLNAKGNAAPDV